MVQELNAFDVTAAETIDDIEGVRSKFASARKLVDSDIGQLQKKIRRKLILVETLKILETIKYIDKANSTIKVLFEKTDYRKVSELISVLSSGFDNQLHRIKIFENKLVEINRLKELCLDNLIKAALGQLSTYQEMIVSNFSHFLRNFNAETNEGEFTMVFEKSALEGVQSILQELRLFGDKNFTMDMATHFSATFHTKTRELSDEVSKLVSFKTYIAVLLASFRNFARLCFQSYRTFMSDQYDREAIEAALGAVIKYSSRFFKVAFDACELEAVKDSEVVQVIKIIEEFPGEFSDEPNASFWQLQLYFKRLVLNARQQQYFKALKTLMEDEEWTPAQILNEHEVLLKDLYEEGSLALEIFSMYFRIGDSKFSLSRSCLSLVSYFSSLLNFQGSVGSLGSELVVKVSKAVELYLYNCEHLLLNGMAPQYKKIAKINTKILGEFISIKRHADRISEDTRREVVA